MDCTQFHIVSLVHCHRQLQSLHHPLHIASLFIFSYMPFLQYEECLAFDFLASKVVYCLAFCLQLPQLNNLYCYELGFYSAKEVILILQNVWRSRNKRTQSPLQGSHTVELDIIKNSCLKIGLLIIFSFIGSMALLTFERIV